MENSLIRVFEYEGTPITFNHGENMVNATDMAKKFGKTTKDWLRTNTTKEFINELSSVRHILPTDLVKVVQGGTPELQGTWMHEDVAIEFARWLNPKFAIWCNDRIKELARYGITATPQTIESILADPDNAILALMELKKAREEARLANEERARLQVINEEQHKKLGEQKGEIRALKSQVQTMEAKSSYVDKIFACKSTVTVTQIAQDYGMVARAFNQVLSKLRIQYKVKKQWILYAPYVNKGYVQSQAVEIVRSNGTRELKYNTEWTQKGRFFLYETLKKHNILPTDEM